VRHLRMVGVVALVVLVVSAVGAGSASAEKGPKYSTSTWGQFKYCPYENPEVQFCYAGITSGGSKGGFFEYGKVKVKLDKPIALQGGYDEVETEEEKEELQVFPAAGIQSLEAPELKVTGGIGLITPRIQENNEWPAALSESWKEAKKNHETAVNVKIELAGNELFDVPGGLNTTNLIFEKGTVFRLPLKVKLTSPWLEKLGSGPCYIGTDENPVHVNLTSGDAGSAGTQEHDEGFHQIILRNSRLVDVHWTIEKESLPKGCGGSYEPYIDGALDSLLEQGGPNKTGIVVLQGNLYTGRTKDVKEHAEKGEI
jgi:hypothetical protein